MAQGKSRQWYEYLMIKPQMPPTKANEHPKIEARVYLWDVRWGAGVWQVAFWYWVRTNNQQLLINNYVTSMIAKQPFPNDKLTNQLISPKYEPSALVETHNVDLPIPTALAELLPGTRTDAGAVGHHVRVHAMLHLGEDHPGGPPPGTCHVPWDGEVMAMIVLLTCRNPLNLPFFSWRAIHMPKKNEIFLCFPPHCLFWVAWACNMPNHSCHQLEQPLLTLDGLLVLGSSLERTLSYRYLSDQSVHISTKSYLSSFCPTYLQDPAGMFYVTWRYVLPHHANGGMFTTMQFRWSFAFPGSLAQYGCFSK